MRAFCFAFRALAGSALPRNRFKGDSLSRLASQAVSKGSVRFTGGGSVELVGLKKAMISTGFAGSDRPMQSKIDKPIKFYARASKIARREILNIGLRGPTILNSAF